MGPLECVCFYVCLCVCVLCVDAEVVIVAGMRGGKGGGVRGRGGGGRGGGREGKEGVFFDRFCGLVGSSKNPSTFLVSWMGGLDVVGWCPLVGWMW